MAPGSEYALSFYSGVGQQYGYSGAADVTLAVSLGNDTQTIGPIHNESHGFTGWAQHTLSFTATASSEVLSFLATGTPSGVPPFVLLDAMALSQIPEPGSIALLGAGLAGLGLICLRRR
ncbi:MAG: PEP-CTERM sorting domain-containing protein [Acetobacteraceae bacterium]|nr:PEP-CTERM sorting domain-containing protein [Acetobacteraceae bacterium]